MEFRELEGRLNGFDPSERASALAALADAAAHRASPPAGRGFNLHCHSFYSYNGFGLSPSGLAWMARVRGLCAVGLVDFDVLDGVEEFLGACGRLGLRGCAGLETRVFVPEFGTRVINSPGEPGITYHMGAGFVPGPVRERELLDRLKATAQGRNRGLVERVNAYLAPAALDYDADVLPLTPAGNATERHICAAYDAKARALFPDVGDLADYWAERLGVSVESAAKLAADPPALHAEIRAKTMKAGGVGYVRPEGPDFPRLDEVHAFILANGAIPVLTWLDGTSEGEEALDELLDVMTAAGAAAINIIPDRNWNIADLKKREDRVARLYRVVDEARARALPIMVGTEMNAPGLKYVDDFDAPELAPLYDTFREGAMILHAHTMLQAAGGMGYLSPWAGKHFATVEQKNRFYAALGEAVVRPLSALPELNDAMSTEEAAASFA